MDFDSSLKKVSIANLLQGHNPTNIYQSATHIRDNSLPKSSLHEVFTGKSLEDHKPGSTSQFLSAVFPKSVRAFKKIPSQAESITLISPDEFSKSSRPKTPMAMPSHFTVQKKSKKNKKDQSTSHFFGTRKKKNPQNHSSQTVLVGKTAENQTALLKELQKKELIIQIYQKMIQICTGSTEQPDFAFQGITRNIGKSVHKHAIPEDMIKIVDDRSKWGEFRSVRNIKGRGTLGRAESATTFSNTSLLQKSTHPTLNKTSFLEKLDAKLNLKFVDTTPQSKDDNYSPSPNTFKKVFIKNKKQPGQNIIPTTSSSFRMKKSVGIVRDNSTKSSETCKYSTSESPFGKRGSASFHISKLFQHICLFKSINRRSN